VKDRPKEWIARALAILGVVTLTAGAVLAQVSRGLFDSDAFADRLAGSLHDSRVSGFVADVMTNAVVQEKPDLVTVRPLLLSTAGSVAQSDAFGAVVRVTARQAHATLLSQGGHALLLSVPDVDLVLRGALAHASPEIAARIPAALPPLIATVGKSPTGQFILGLWQLGRHVTWMALAGVLAGLALVVAGIALAPWRARALRHAALDLALAGLVLVMLEPLGGVAVGSLPDLPLARAAATGVYDAFAAGIRDLALGLAGVGLVFYAAAQTPVSRRWLFEKGRSAGAWLVRAQLSPTQQILRGALLVAAGGAMVVRPATTLSVLTVATGVFLAFVGVQQLFLQVTCSPAGPRAEKVEPPPTGAVARRHAIVMLVVAGVVAGAIAWLRRPLEHAIVRAPPGCNGDPRLCPKRLDQVVFAGTHNAMSAAPSAGWMFASHERDLAGQLDDGVRAFLIDVHPGVPVSGSVKTEVSDDPELLRAMEKTVGKDGLQAAMRIRERLGGQPEGPSALYLCHGFCELGASPLVPWLRVLREFLVVNPREVVILVIEDYAPPAEIAAAFRESGLAELAYRGSVRPPWPTLQEMAASGQRAVVFLESGKPGVDWLHPAYEAIQETPYRFRTPTEMSCAPNRGGTIGSLFLMNHWIETAPTPRPSNAAIVNAYDFLLRRAEQCARERARLPNIVAVDFYRTGDLFRVVKRLNGLDARP
jgi:hypothetical protein